MKYVFLLGGQDLEMVEIAEMLEKAGEEYIDKKLSWGATLSAYQEDLGREDVVYVGIELVEDITTPTNYKAVDHHNERSHEPASIEQVADLLGIGLSRYQQLVAANDRGYIPAMEEMGASVFEIQKVRRADRKAQGVTEQMERQAQRDLATRRTEKGVVVVKTKLKTFSPITDRIRAKRLLVYNEETFCYYGVGAANLAVDFKSLIDEQKAYFGGGRDGFFGLVGGELGEKEVEGMVWEIVERGGGDE